MLLLDPSPYLSEKWLFLLVSVFACVMCCRCVTWHACRGQRVIFWNPLSPSTLKWDLGIKPRSSELHRKSLYLLTHFASSLLFHPLVAPAREGRCFSPRKVSSGGDRAKNAHSLARPLQFCFESGLSLPLAYLISIYFWPQAPWETEVNSESPATEFYSLTKQGQRSLKSCPGRMLSKFWFSIQFG